MSNLPPSNDWHELCAEMALGELTSAEAERLERVPMADVAEQTESLSLTAAAIQTMLVRSQPSEIPAALRRQIESEATVHIGRSSTAGRKREWDADGLARSTERIAGQRIGRDDALENDGVAREVDRGPMDRSLQRRERFAWLAAAAALLLALGLYVGQPDSPTGAQTDFAAARSQLLASADDVIKVAWTPGTTPFDSPVSGDVVWSTQRQEGYLRFEALPANDPTVDQYQLWIIDPARDDEPIDGGVFDAASDGETMVRIDAKLNVVAPAAFAITIEKPGGVVVSDQERLPLLAAVK